ncbi:hypothetical protein [Microcoleus sp. B9-D4]|uniref:hypothetical protein n=1 Tax=Microcoleus sp. B9-D4 TaxID=2818711 RepID=UPI002FD0A39A
MKKATPLINRAPPNQIAFGQGSGNSSKIAPELRIADGHHTHGKVNHPTPMSLRDPQATEYRYGVGTEIAELTSLSGSPTTFKVSV